MTLNPLASVLRRCAFAFHWIVFLQYGYHEIFYPTTEYAAASPNHFNLWGCKPFYFSRSRVVPNLLSVK